MTPLPSLLFDSQNTSPVALEVYKRVWRKTLEQPGFAIVRFAHSIDSKSLRKTMFAVVEAFPEQFVVERLGRFDQQVSSKFHRDGAPLASFLLLGYEPTSIRSRFWIADCSAAAVAEGIELDQFLAKYNPMFATGEKKLDPFIIELDLPHGESFLLAINNSLLPFDSARGNPLGVLHKVVIGEPDPGIRRVINSIGLTLPSENISKLDAGIKKFLTQDELD